MSRTTNVQRLARAVDALPEAPPAAEPAAADVEPAELAREVVRAFAEEWKRFRTAGDRENQRLDPSEPPPDWLIESILKRPPERVTFFDLERLARVDPGQSHARWEEVKAAARRDLDSGWQAARALEPWGGSAWERACFHALRRRLREAWPPRHAGEASLIDEMAQYEWLRHHWLGIAAMLSRAPRMIIGLSEKKGESDDAVLGAVAVREALHMVERCQRLYQTALRSLLSARRGGSPVFVRRAAQVNVAAGPQLNVAPLSVEPAVLDDPRTGEE